MSARDRLGVRLVRDLAVTIHPGTHLGFPSITYENPLLQFYILLSTVKQSIPFTE
jgi:hypothetical protein